MAQRDAVVEKNSTIAPALSKTMMQGENFKTVQLVDFRGDANADRPADYFLYVYNIAPRTFSIPRPPNFPLIKLSACPKTVEDAVTLNVPDEELVWDAAKKRILARKVARIQNIVNEKWVDADSGEVRVRGINGERFAMDLINPSNLGINMWADFGDDPERNWLDNNGTDDMSRRGLFWTRNDPPTADELSRAKQRLETHYQRMLRQADDYERDPATRKMIGFEHHLAAEYYNYEAPWHRIAAVKATCENCGENLPRPDAAYHRNSMGVVCVRDWKRAHEAGAVKLEDVPETKRWKS